MILIKELNTNIAVIILRFSQVQQQLAAALARLR